MVNSRYACLARILDESRYFKVVCAAGNEDAADVRRLSTIYTLAGANAIDVSANVEVVRGAVEGVERALALAPTLHRVVAARPYVNVSIGLKGDPHVRKARIVAEECTACGACRDACPPNAIDDDMVVDEAHCIGCGDCAAPCPVGAVEFYDKRVDYSVVLPECLSLGAETLELHASSTDDEGVLAEWRLVNELVDSNFVSICLDRSLLSNEHLIKRVRQAHEIALDRLMVQADGVPMSGGDDDFKSTLQTIATAETVLRSGIPAKVIASGGTNSKTMRLAELCGVGIHGVAIGSFARKIVKAEITQPDFDVNVDLIEAAVAKAERLVSANVPARAG